MYRNSNDFVRLTECCECGRDTYLIGWLCRPCAIDMGYETEDE